MYPENEGFGEIKLNDVIEVVGFFDKRIIEVDDMDLESPLMQEKYCIHVVQYKLFPNVALYNIETGKIDLFDFINTILIIMLLIHLCY